MKRSTCCLLAGLWGCAQDAEKDRARYQRALATTDPASATAICAEIVDPDLRGECLVGIARVAAGAGAAETAWAACDAIGAVATQTPSRQARPGGARPGETGPLQAGPWREECVFAVVDALEMVGPEAWRACAAAGRYRQPCVGHAVTRAIASWTDLPLEIGQEAALELEIRRRVRRLSPPMGRGPVQTPIVTGTVRKIAQRWEGRTFDAAECGVATEERCAHAYGETMPTHMPEVDRGAICGRALNVEGVQAAGGAPWIPGSEAVVLRAWSDLCRSWGQPPPTLGVGGG